MEQDCIAGLYRSLGMSVGAEFSSEDVSLLYRKVFNVPSDTDEAHVAMKKMAGGENSWSCVGENVLDVLLEMEREREKKEKLYWDLQLLNVGNLDPLYVMDKPVFINAHVLNCQHQSTHPNTFKKAHNQSGSSQSCTFDTGSLQRERLVGGGEQYGSVRGVRRLKKAARQFWARLASEGAQSTLPSPWQRQSLEVSSQAWGCVSLSDVLLLVEVKYDVVTHLLYTEMLQEHYTLSFWETLLPWQQHMEEEGLEDLAEEALESGDMLLLAELPGAFRIYRSCLGASSRSRPESGEQSWSAVSLLYELHTFRQQERDTIRVLGERLDRESLRLLCLYISLATLRAQREKMSYSALLAARQSWETWPHVKSPCRAEQAALWLHGEEEEQKKVFISVSPQKQAVLQLLVLTQEQERKHLVKSVRGISLEDLQEPGCTVPPKECKSSHQEAALRNGCIKMLRQIQTGLQTHNETQTPLKPTNPQPHLQPQPHMQAHISNQPPMWSPHQLEDCSLLLLTHLMELHEVKASALLPALVDKSAQGVRALRDEYESQLQGQRYTNPLQLLVSGAPLASGSILTRYPNSTEMSSNEQITGQSCCSAAVDAQNSSDGPAEASRVDSIRRASRELNGVQAADGTDKQDIYTGSGVAMEDLPYLEILCVSDAATNTHQGLAAEEGAQEEEGSGKKSPQSYEKQGSLITLAWSKPPEDDIDYEAEAAIGRTGQSQDAESSLKTKVQPSDISGPSEHTQYEKTSAERGREDLFQSDSTCHPDAQSADQQCNTVEQLTLEESAMADQPEKGDFQTHALVAKTLQGVQPHRLVDSTENKQHAGDPCHCLTNENVDREEPEVEMCPTATKSELWDLRGPEPTENQKYNSQATVDCSPAERESTLMERQRTTEPVSAVERERTMRNLVDMQRKVEQRQQRDRERQLLRVQERLSIIQNRKAEEDLLGLKHTDRLRHLTQDLPPEDKNQQKTVVRERLDQLRRERSYVMQSKRDRNTTGFKELLGPVARQSRETDDGAD